jgi:hypothetical protein
LPCAFYRHARQSLQKNLPCIEIDARQTLQKKIKKGKSLPVAAISCSGHPIITEKKTKARGLPVVTITNCFGHPPRKGMGRPRSAAALGLLPSFMPSPAQLLARIRHNLYTTMKIREENLDLGARREERCDNPPRKVLYYRLRPIHFGH